jgi:hypothetical protein
VNTILTDLIPAKYRKVLYGILTLVAFGYGLWQASDGDWNQFAAAVITALIGALATSNTDVEPEPAPLDITYGQQQPVENDEGEPYQPGGAHNIAADPAADPDERYRG